MPELNFSNTPILLEGENRQRLPLINEQNALVFKASSFQLTIARLASTDLTRIKTELNIKTNQAPAFFQDISVVLDLQAVDVPSLDIKSLIEIFRGHGIQILGVRHANNAQQIEARALGLAIFPIARKEETRSNDSKIKPKIWAQPVRSGQQVYAAGTDLIVLGMVNSGAEVLADGNIHCYAPLRGRALAGVKGDNEARIFTYCLEAELLSVAGFYRVIESVKELSVEVRGKGAQIYLSGERIIIEAV